MANFDVQIQDIIGAFSDQAAMDDFMTAGCKEIINSLPPQLLLKCADLTTLNNVTPSLDTLDTKGLVLDVLRYDGTIDQPCRLVPVYKRGRIQDSSDMEVATVTDPAYLILDNTLEIYPEPTSSQVGRVHHVIYPTVDASAVSTISNFPDEAEYLVVLYSSIKALGKNIIDLKKSDLSISASAPNVPSLGTVSYSDASNADASASSVSSITVSSVSVADISSNLPTYTKPSSTVNFGSGNNFDTLLATDEDIELASVELQKQNQLLDAHRTDVQNELNEFNKENAKYQASVQSVLAKHNSDLQVELRQAQLDAADAQQEASQATDVDKFNKAQDQALDLQNKSNTLQATIQNNDDLIQKFSTELNKYSAQVNSEVQEYSQNLNTNQQNYNMYLQQQVKLQQDYDKGLAQLVN